MKSIQFQKLKGVVWWNRVFFGECLFHCNIFLWKNRALLRICHEIAKWEKLRPAVDGWKWRKMISLIPFNWSKIFTSADSKTFWHSLVCFQLNPLTNEEKTTNIITIVYTTRKKLVVETFFCHQILDRTVVIKKFIDNFKNSVHL